MTPRPARSATRGIRCSSRPPRHACFGHSRRQRDPRPRQMLLHVCVSSVSMINPVRSAVGRSLSATLGAATVSIRICDQNPPIFAKGSADFLRFGVVAGEPPLAACRPYGLTISPTTIPPSRFACHLPLHKGGSGLVATIRQPITLVGAIIDRPRYLENERTVESRKSTACPYR